MTGITFGGAGITPTPAVNFGYDAVGNRLWMTDGLGRVDYSYDALSQLQWENRQFTNIANPLSADGKYKLSYSYTIGGALKSVTDPFGSTINYTYDSAGELTNVTGTAYAGITNYVTEIQRRAWGATKHLKYGDNVTLDMTYNNRLSPSQYDFKNAAGTRLMGAIYTYHDDGRLGFVDDLREDRFDRLYQYDHVGRVIKAETGYKARGEQYPGNNSKNGPYNHYYGYDEFDHLTSRTGHYWYRESGETYTATYKNNRNETAGWLYDADGRLTQSKVFTSTSGTTPVTQNFTYDAAGQRTDAGKYDGDGRRVQASDGKRYDLRSSALGGNSITEIYSETYELANLRGRKATTFVYVGSEVIAEQYTNYAPSASGVQAIKWVRRDVAQTSVFKAETNPAYVDTEAAQALDIQGVATEVPDYARLQQNQNYYTQHYGSYNYGGSSSGYSSSWGGGMPGNFGTGCAMGGSAMSCSDAVRGFNNGSLVLDPRYHDTRLPNGAHVPMLPLFSPISFFFGSPTGDRSRSAPFAMYIGPINANPGSPPSGPTTTPTTSENQGDPCDVKITSERDKATVAVALGEGTPFNSPGQFPKPQITNESLLPLTEREFRLEAYYMASVITNRFNTGKFATYADVVNEKNKDGKLRFLGAPDGWERLNQLGNNGSEYCERARYIMDALGTIDRHGAAPDIKFWRGVEQQQLSSGRRAFRIGDIRAANTDFMVHDPITKYYDGLPYWTTKGWKTPSRR
jgi:YD repeat-containing protein